jgi:arylsulfatase A-like enzyme
MIHCVIRKSWSALKQRFAALSRKKKPKPISGPTLNIFFESPETRPNVLFIALDDLNDWIKVLDPNAPIQTPNIECLAERGVLFTKAYCASAACNPSRTSILTGLRPSTTGVYGNKTDWRKALPNAVTLPQHFMAHGYRAEGAGKIFHHH